MASALKTEAPKEEEEEEDEPWIGDMPILSEYLKSIGASHVRNYVPQPQPQPRIRPLTTEEREKWDAERAEHEKKMQEWEAKREKEMEEENGPAWKLLCDLRAKRAEKEAAGKTGHELITTATSWGEGHLEIK